MAEIFGFFLQTGALLGALSETLLVLIPKMEHPKTLLQFRPISLCNVAYKAITKLFVTHLKPFVENWISPNQTSFVLKRMITDNIVMVQEVIHSMRSQKKKFDGN